MEINTINSDIEADLIKSQLEIHIKIKQRNGRKCWTTIEGLDKIKVDNKSTDEFLLEVSKKFKKKYSCGATIMKPENSIQLNGDHRNNIKEFLIFNKLVNENQIKMHGF